MEANELTKREQIRLIAEHYRVTQEGKFIYAGDNGERMEMTEEELDRRYHQELKEKGLE